MTSIVQTWRCIGGGYGIPSCGASGEGDRADKDAEKHTTTTGHATVSSGRPA